MPLYEASALTTLVGATADSVLGAFRAGTKPCTIYEVHLFTITAPTTSGQVTLKRSTAIGTGAITGNLGVALDPTTGVPAALGQAVTAWGTAAPTVTANPAGAFRRFGLGPAIGNGIVWVFDGKGLLVPANSVVNSELCLVNLNGTAPGTYAITFKFEE